MRYPLTALAVLLLLSAAPASRAADVVPGEPLAETLEKYRAEGVRLVYATGLVPDRYRVAAAPDPAAPVETQLRMLLEPFGLTLTAGADGIWIVAAGTETAPVPPDPAPVVPTVIEPAVEEVLVTAAHHRLLRTPTPAQSLSSRELDSTPSAGRDLFRAVTSLPGQANDGVTARQKIRGGSENEVLYLVDGTQLIAPFHLEGFFSPFSALDSNVVDAVDVYNAGYPTRFGTRSGGVLDLTLSRTDAAFSGSVDLNLLRAAVSAQGAAANWQWLASARRGTVDYVLSQLKTDYGRPEFHDELLRLARETDDSLIAFGVLNSGDEVLLKNPSINEEGSMDRDNLTAWAVLDVLLGGRTRVVGRSSYNRIRGSREGTLDNPVDAVGSVENAEKIEITRFSAELGRTLTDRLALTAGAEYQYHQGSFDGHLQSVYGPLGTPIQSGPGLDRTFDVSRKGNMAAVYASISSQLTDRLEMELGLRWDYQDIDPVHDDQWSPRLQVNFDATDRLRLFLNLGRYVQHQYLFEIPLDDGLIELAPPQLVDQLSVGAELYWSDRLQVLVEAYGKRIRDPQTRADNLYNRYVLLPEIHADRELLMPEKARASGIEVSFAGNLTNRLGWRLGYVYADVSERLFGDWRPRPWDQHHAVRAQLDWEGERWQASLHAVYHDGWATTDLVTDPVVGVSAYNEARLPDYVSIDASVSRLWRFQRSTLEAYLQVSNLFDHSNIGGYDYVLEDDGQWEGDARTLLPVLPVLGLKYAW
ncbi:MAG: TonB-dependent receptor plug domain-containing protein [Pseudomonadales bacterium]